MTNNSTLELPVIPRQERIARAVLGMALIVGLFTVVVATLGVVDWWRQRRIARLLDEAVRRGEVTT